MGTSRLRTYVAFRPAFLIICDRSEAQLFEQGNISSPTPVRIHGDHAAARATTPPYHAAISMGVCTASIWGRRVETGEEQGARREGCGSSRPLAVLEGLASPGPAGRGGGLGGQTARADQVRRGFIATAGTATAGRITRVMASRASGGAFALGRRRAKRGTTVGPALLEVTGRAMQGIVRTRKVQAGTRAGIKPPQVAIGVIGAGEAAVAGRGGVAFGASGLAVEALGLRGAGAGGPVGSTGRLVDAGGPSIVDGARRGTKGRARRPRARMGGTTKRATASEGGIPGGALRGEVLGEATPTPTPLLGIGLGAPRRQGARFRVRGRRPATTKVKSGRSRPGGTRATIVGRGVAGTTPIEDQEGLGGAFLGAPSLSGSHGRASAGSPGRPGRPRRKPSLS